LEYLVYREDVPLTRWALFMIGLFVTVLSPIILLEALAIQVEPRLLWLYLLLDLFFIIILLNFRKLTVEIEETQLVVSFGVIRKKIHVESIISCEPVNATLRVYTGMGIRYGGNGSLAYLPKLGEAVKLNIKDSRSFVFSTRNQKTVVEIIRQLIKKNQYRNF
jgi:hypothetical protein